MNRQRHNCATCILSIFLLLSTGFSSYSQKRSYQSKTLRVFMIGNSFSENASQFLPQLSREGGHTLILGKAEIGGSSLERHWHHIEAAEKNKEDPEGKPYDGKSLRMLLSEGSWDLVTIQQASILSGDPETYQPYAQKLYDYIKLLQPKAQVVFHETWAYRVDSNDFTQTAKGDSAKSARKMWHHLRNAYQNISRQLDIPIIPTGDAFWMINSSPIWGFKPAPFASVGQYKEPATPQQTYSLHVGYFWKNNQLLFDSHHANTAGCYLGGLVWYGFLFKESPEKLQFLPQGLSPLFAKQLRKVAWTVVEEAFNVKEVK